MNNEIGAFWSKWDLHVHTPSSFFTRYEGDEQQSWDKFIEDLEFLPSEFKVIGINDYFFLDGYKRIISERQNGRLQNIELFLPVIELRLSHLSGNDATRKLNYHIIFSNELKTEEDIQHHFINNLTIENELQSGDQFIEKLSKDSITKLGQKIREGTPTQKQNSLSKDNLFLGFEHLTFSYEKIKELLKASRFKDKYLVGLGKTEWDKFKWEKAAPVKKTLSNNADFLFTASENVSSYHNGKSKLLEQNVNHKLLDCSDAHAFSHNDKEKDRIGNCDTWMKAELSFGGLKHTLKEFEDRVFIGKEPNKISLVKSNPGNFLKSIQINKNPDSSFSEKWFNQKIQLNQDLVSIIGNKGSGKSALADILGLVGDTKNFRHFSFLNKDKFREVKRNPSQHYTVMGSWATNVNVPRKLCDDPEKSNPERIKYIPQNYLETLCNKLDSETESDFEKELKLVIFSHIPPSKRLGFTDLDSLISHKTDITEKNIQKETLDLTNVNRLIVETEKRIQKDFLDFHTKKLEQLEIELKIIEESKPEEVPDPSEDPETKQETKEINEEINKLEAKLQELDKKINAKTKVLASLEIKKSNLEKIVSEINFLKKSKERVLIENLEISKDLGINLNEVLELKINVSILKTKCEDIKQRIDETRILLDPENEKSPIAMKSIVEMGVSKNKDRLSGKNRNFQEYKDELKKWNLRKKELIGNKETEGSILFQKNVIDKIDSAPLKLQELEGLRDERSKKIYNLIKNLVGVYEELYKPVQEFIKTFKVIEDTLGLSFQVDVVNSGFQEKFFSFISHSKAGSFHGQEPGKEKIDKLLEITDLNNFKSSIEFTKSVIQKLRKDDRGDSGELKSVENQLRTGKSVIDLYNFLSSFDYLKPKYALRVGGKELTQLSPGERGLLLLVFYLLVDKSSVPIIIDQPEGNLDNQTVKALLVPAIKNAKNRRQVFLVTHNPNLAVVCDSEQIIVATMDKVQDNKVSYKAGPIENPEINESIVKILEGTWPAFENRSSKYIRPKS